MKKFYIDNKVITQNSKPYIIAEACINHEGKIKLAKKMVDLAAQAKASAIKFQMHVLDDEMLKKTPKSKNFDLNLYETLKKTNLTIEEHIMLKKYCAKKNIDYLCTPFSFKSADILEKKINLKFFKTGSGELTNHPFQIHVAKKKRPTIISTGMSTMSEVSETINIVKKINSNIAIMQCTSVYPCPYEISNIGVITEYIKKFNLITGLSDHTSSIYTSIGAVALGARIIEKHFTLDKKMKGPDHASSIEPEELKELVEGCNAVFEARSSKKKIHYREKEIISWARESVVSIKKIKKGEKFSFQNISVKRPAPSRKEIAAKDFKKILGKLSKKEIKANVKLKWTEIK